MYGDIKVTVEKVADTVPLETTFDICLRITNCWYVFSYYSRLRVMVTLK